LTTALLACVVLVAACSGNAKPQVLPTLQSTPTATVAPVAIPSAATVHNAFGAAAFVRFYYGQLNLAWSGPDPTRLTALSDPACGTCRNYIQAAKDFASRQQRIRGTSVRVLTAEAPPMQNGLVAVDLTFDEPARAIVDQEGRVVRELRASPAYHWTIYVKSVALGWRVRAAVKSK
jgi:hypothetical protein